MKLNVSFKGLTTILVLAVAFSLWGITKVSAAGITDVMTYQAESYETPSKASAPFAHQTTGAVFSRFDAAGIGDYAVYTIPADQSGYYNLTIHYRRHETTGISDLYVNGIKQSTGFDNTAGSSYNSYYDCTIRVFLERGNNELKFLITGKGAAGYKLNIDYFKLTRITPSMPADGIFQAENNEFADKSNAVFVHQTDGTTFSRFDADGIGDYAVYELPADEAGYYNVTIRYRKHETTGKADFYLNGMKQSFGFDNTAGSSNNTFYTTTVTVFLEKGYNEFKYVITVKGETGYKLNIDYFQLTKQGFSVPANGTYEAETYAFPAKSSAAMAVQTTGSTFSRFDAAGIGDYAVYEIPVNTEGDYTLTLHYRRHETTGVADFYVNGIKQGTNFDNTEGTVYNSFYDLVMKVHLEKGYNELKFVITGPGSTGYKLNIDYFNVSSYTAVNPGSSQTSSSGNVISYPKPQVYTASSAYSVTADGVTIPVLSYNTSYDYAEFSMKSTAVTVKITAAVNITSYSISPLKLGITGTVSGNTLTFTMPEDEYLIITINGNTKRLVLMGDPMETDIPASTGEGIFNITDIPYNADNSGLLLATAAIQSAINDASAYGTLAGDGRRGVVYIPAGTYLVTSLALKSNVDLYIAGGATLRATTDVSKYTVRGYKTSIGKDVTHIIYTYNNLIDDPYADGYTDSANFVESTNMRIYGRGTVDANGKAIDSLGLLTETMSISNCSNFSTDGIIYRDSGVWSVIVGYSNDLFFTNFKVLNQFIHEDDCIDVNGCQNVLVQNSIGIAWDDPYTTKTFEGGELMQSMNGEPEPCYNVTFDDCISWTGCYGYKAGQGAFLDQDLITFKNSTVYDCAVGIGVHHKYGNGVFSNITFENIDIENISYNNDGHSTWVHMQAITPAADGKAPITNITVKNINVRDKGTSGGKIVGYDSRYQVDGVNFSNILMPDSISYASNYTDLDLEHLTYCKNLYVNGVKMTDGACPVIYQFETVPYTVSTGAAVSVGTDGYIYFGSAVGQYLELPVTISEAGTYNLQVLLKKHSSKGIFQLYVNGTPQGIPFDQYYNGNLVGVTADFGTVNFDAPGIYTVKFEIVGKNASSSGYALALDALTLTKQ